MLGGSSEKVAELEDNAPIPFDYRRVRAPRCTEAEALVEMTGSVGERMRRGLGEERVANKDLRRRRHCTAVSATLALGEFHAPPRHHFRLRNAQQLPGPFCPIQPGCR